MVNVSVTIQKSVLRFFFSHFYYLVQYVKNQSFLMAFICFVGTSSVNVLRDVIREDLSSFYTHAE